MLGNPELDITLESGKREWRKAVAKAIWIVCFLQMLKSLFFECCKIEPRLLRCKRKMEFLVGGGSFDSLGLFRLVHLGIGSYLCWLGRICKLIRRPFGCNGLGLLGALLMNEPSLPSRYGECFCCLISFVSLWFGSLQIRGECLVCCLI